MQRIMNDPDNIVDEMLQGFLKTHSDLVERSENGRVVRSAHMEPGRTGVVAGGGSGHKPAFIGYVGEGMCDAAAVGEICSSPTAAAFLDAFQRNLSPSGILGKWGNDYDLYRYRCHLSTDKKESVNDLQFPFGYRLSESSKNNIIL